MSYQASIHHLITGQFLAQLSVEGNDLHEAEKAAITKAALASNSLPRDMDVRQLHQCFLQNKVPDSKPIVWSHQ
jgi:hypothetical protein